MDQIDADDEISEFSLNMQAKLPMSFTKSNVFETVKENPLALPEKIEEITIPISKPMDDGVAKPQDASPRAKIKKYFFSRKTFKIAKTLANKGNNRNSKNENQLKVPQITKNVFAIAKVIRNSTNKILEFYKKKKLYQSPSNVNFYHFSIINDKGSFFEKLDAKKKRDQSKYSCFHILWKLFDAIHRVYSKSIVKAGIKYLRNHVPTINSSSRLKILWDFIVLLFSFVSVIWYTIQKCFIPDENMNHNQYIMNSYLSLLIILYIDIGINLNTDYYQDGIQIKNRYKIYRKYFTANYLTDIIPCLGLSLFYYFNNHEVFANFSVLLILKLFKADELADRIKNLILRNDQSESLYKLLILLCTIFLWGHVLACLWHLIAIKYSVYETYDVNWLRAKNLELSSWTTRYLYSFYWAFTTMLTVGYGDVIPTNNLEMFFNIWAMFLGCGMFGYSMNSIGDILKFAGRKSRLLKEQMDRVNIMMRDKNLPDETQLKIRKYLEFVWKQEQREDPEYEKLIMGKLSSTLRDEINYNTNVKYMKSVACFKVFSDKTLIQLANHLQKVRFSPEEFVYREGEYEDPSIFFVVDGNLALVSQKSGGKGLITWRNYKKGDCIGVQELFSGKARNFSVLSSDFSTLFQMTRKDFITVVSKNQEDFEKFSFIKDQEIVYNEKSQYKIECCSCGYKDHCESDCKFFKHLPDRLVLLGRYNFKRKCFEKSFQRKRRKVFHPLVTKRVVIEGLNIFNEVYSDDDDYNDLQDMYENLNNDDDDIEIPMRKEAAEEPEEKQKKSEEAGKKARRSFDMLARRKSTKQLSAGALRGNQPKKRISKLANDLHFTEDAEGPKIVAPASASRKRISKLLPDMGPSEEPEGAKGNGSRKRISKLMNELHISEDPSTKKRISRMFNNELKNPIIEEDDMETSQKINKNFVSQKSTASFRSLPKTPSAIEKPIEKSALVTAPAFSKGVEETLAFDKLRSYKYYYPRNNIELVACRTNNIRFGVEENNSNSKQAQDFNNYPFIPKPTIQRKTINIQDERGQLRVSFSPPRNEESPGFNQEDTTPLN